MMTRLGTLVTSTIVVVLVSAVPDASGQVRGVSPGGNPTLRPIAASLPGSLEGVVLDDSGLPVVGATISALGPTSALAVSDRVGRFRLAALPPGPYLIRAHVPGYLASRRMFVEVRASARTTMAVSVRRADARVLAAGMAGTTDDTTSTEDHGEVAWRLRHLKRSPLKDTTDRLAMGDAEESSPFGKTGSLMRASSRAASSFFEDLPFTGQVNLLTSGSFEDVDRMFSSDMLSRGFAAVSLAGSAGGWGDWSIQGITSQGDLGSWFLSGSFKSRAPASHVYDINVSYTAQRLTSTMSGPDTFHGIGDGSRALGSVYAVDRWQVSPEVTITYAARYSRYDYLGGPGLVSPRADVALKPAKSVQLHVSASSHVLAPGAEDFLPPLVPGVWVPSERTFDWLSTSALRAERANTYEFRIEHDLGEGYWVTGRAFYQEVQNQLAALFGSATNVSALPDSGYHVGGVGDVDAHGWSLTLSNNAHRVRGSLGYQMTTTSWFDVADGRLIAAAAPSLLRAPETLHDITATIETDVPGTRTRLFMLCKVNSGFSQRTSAADGRPGLDGRFDVQITQPLPLLDFTSAQWQLVFAVHNMFRELSADASVYDELLVVRPPKRLVGGLIVRF